MKWLKEFKEFALKGNVVDMAVGVIIGGAFGKIVTSLVNDMVMPALSLITGKINLSDFAVLVPASAEGAEPIAIKIGSFAQNILDFLIIALCIFLAVKLMNAVRSRYEKKEEAVEEAVQAIPSPEEVLLTEIRDLLKENRTNARTEESIPEEE